MSRIVPNRFRNQSQIDNVSSVDSISFHQSLTDYKATPLVNLPTLAEKLGVGAIHVKDESHRFGLKAFKGLGASYAVYRYIKKRWEREFGVEFKSEFLFQPEMLNRLKLPVFSSATDGNHGRALAWFSRLINHKAIIYMPKDSVDARIKNIQNEGAEVVIVNGNYDKAVIQCAEDSERFGYQIISDTSYPGYHEIPRDIMTGYYTMFEEIDLELEFDFIFIQSGVGSVTASAVEFYNNKSYNPKLIAVEPTESACLLESIESGNGERITCRGRLDSIMAGLNCGLPSEIGWPIIKSGIDYFMAIEDDYAKKAMWQFYYPLGPDTQIISGESGAAGLGAVIASTENNDLRNQLGLTNSSKLLLFNTEGDTDPVGFKSVIS